MQTVQPEARQREIIALLAVPIAGLLAEEQELFRLRVGERAVAHQLAWRLRAPAFERGLAVDIEYNRHINTTKEVPIDAIGGRLLQLIDEERLGRTRHRREAAITERLREMDIERIRPRRVIPDIVLHVRGNDTANFLVIELKVNATSLFDEALDWAKLMVFTATDRRLQRDPEGFRYDSGVFLHLTRRGVGQAWLFTDGQPTEITGPLRQAVRAARTGR